MGTSISLILLRSPSLRSLCTCSCSQGSIYLYKDSYYYTRLLQHCISPQILNTIHGQIITSGLQKSPFLAAKLVSQYADFCRMEDARQVFDVVSNRDVLLWNVVVRGYANLGPFEKAVEVYQLMRCSGVCPNRYTFPFVLKACAALGDGRKGQAIHGHVFRAGFESDLFVGNALVALYARCGDVVIARKLFDGIPGRDLVSWNSMIAGYSQNNCVHQALMLFHKMLRERTASMPDRVTCVTLLPVCAQLAAVQEGMWIHSYIIKMGMEVDVALGSGLVGMYARCGHLDVAHDIFLRIPNKNIVVWNAIIGGFGMHGLADQAIEMFTQMVEEGVRPDDISILCIISACSHGGMVEKGLEIFERMEDYGVERNVGHYACVVDLLGRAGRLHEAFTFIESMPMDGGKDVWGALLGACRIHNNLELAEQAARRLFVLDQENAGRYVLLAKMYEVAGRFDDAARVRKMMKERRVRKPLGCSEIEVDRIIHTFGVEDGSHPMTGQIYDTLDRLEMVIEDVAG
ncbi:hypothetical protein MRB53_033355 [Persea americana]|uniref:Uncharacterized protein n=1 Tax=Persea americana TaxID=3435 RepID=A0ACC2KUK2_PERAE|nr:hypothetical protein MRB53_033355 [Persea americana]